MARILSVPSGITGVASRHSGTASADIQTTQRVWRRAVAAFTHPRRRGGRVAHFVGDCPTAPSGGAYSLAKSLPSACFGLKILRWPSAALYLVSFGTSGEKR